MDYADLRARQPRVTAALSRLAVRPPAVLLLEGGSLEARQNVGLFWAAALSCQGEEPPCGGCSACQAIAHAASRDVEWIRGEEGEIKVDTVRALRHKSMDPPAAAPWRLVLITEAQAMNTSAQNALLKVLEEPAPRTVFCLTLPHRDAVLPTVVSRSVCLTLAPEAQPVAPEVGTWLASLAKFVGSGGGDWLSRTGGGVESTLALAVVVEVERAVLGALRGVPQGPLADVFTRRGDIVRLRQAQLLAEEARMRLQLGVGPGIVLEALAMGLWRLLA